MKIIRDGHVHSHYCPHGTKDSFEEYVQKALEEGIKEITFTEHLPLPLDFTDEKTINTSAPKEEVMMAYFKELNSLKKKYEGIIKINSGVEVDYLEDLEEKTKEILKGYGEYIEDSIISVHFLKINGKYYCMDENKEVFGQVVNELGSLDKVYDKYFETLLKSIKSDLGKYKPKRVGHPTLVRIFNLLYPYEYKNTELIKEIITEIKNRNYEVEINTAGLRKPYCKEVYPSGEFFDLVKENNLKIVYGSDAHEAKDVARDFDKVFIR